MIKFANGTQGFFCGCCGAELPVPPEAGTPPPMAVSVCPKCGAGVQVPMNPKSAPFLLRIENEDTLPLREANKLHEMRGQLRHKGILRAVPPPAPAPVSPATPASPAMPASPATLVVDGKDR